MTKRIDRNFVVLGGVGAIGRVVVRDLFESHPRNHILIADYNEVGARAYARSFRGRRVSATFVDAGQSKRLAKLFRDRAVVINCTQHDFNLKVMRAALAAKVHYVDLGGLFHWTRRQLKLNRQFKRAGLTAILGAGCAPGITNVMTRAAADRFDCLTSVRIRVGAKDLEAKSTDFFFPYSAQTIVEELTLKPWVAKAIGYGTIALVIALALWIIWRELRYANVPARRRRPSGGLGRNEWRPQAFAAELRAGDLDRLPLWERPALLLQLLVQALRQARRLGLERALTFRELAERAQLDDELQRARFERIAQLAERQRYGARSQSPTPGSDEQLRESLADGLSLYAQLRATAVAHP